MMRRRRLLAQLDRLDGGTQSPVVTIALGLCETREGYDRAFARAWRKAPDGSLVFCWLREITDLEFRGMVDGSLLPPHVTGIYVKPFEGER